MDKGDGRVISLRKIKLKKRFSYLIYIYERLKSLFKKETPKTVQKKGHKNSNKYKSVNH